MQPIAISKADHNALSIAVRHVLPPQELCGTVGGSLGINKDDLTTFKTTVHKDNQGAQKLTNLNQGNNIPRSKHYDVQTHWFRSRLKPNQTL